MRFRREVLTGDHQQVVLMTIPPGGEIGEEVHPDTGQVLFLSTAKVRRASATRPPTLQANDLVFVRVGTRHNFVNTGRRPLRLITTYAPPHHAPGTLHLTKEASEAAERAAD